MEKTLKKLLNLREEENQDIAKGYENINKREIDILDTQLKNIDEKIKLLQQQKTDVQNRKKELLTKKQGM